MAKKITQNINKDRFFNDLPKVKPESSTWLTRHANYQSCNLGQIVPIYYDEVLPDEKRKITMGMISHTTTPIAPIFNSLYTEIRAFFVPHRLSAELLDGFSHRKSPFVKVFGESPEGDNADIIVPLNSQKLPSLTDDFIGNVDNYLVSQTDFNNVFDSLDISSESTSYYNYLSLAAYELIYQRHYRNEDFESATESPLYRFLFASYYDGETTLSTDFKFHMANREKDYFTGVKPFSQKGDSVIVGVGGYAPVEVKNIDSSRDIEPNDLLELKHTGITDVTPGKYGSVGGESQNNEALFGLYANLKSATGISIEELRLLIKTQELLEKDAIYGTRYAESLNAHFGCCPLDLTLQDPQELYRTTITSNMQAIFQTSSTSGEASILGTIGANSTTQTDSFVILPETKFKEHGILMICAVHKMQNVYDSRFFSPRFNFKTSRFDFYTPELNDLGYQKMLDGEANQMSGNAFNEAFAEYRYKFNKRHGSLNSNFPYWAPSINDEYTGWSTLYKESPIILDDALSVHSSSAPQFYDAWGFEEVNTKPMSLHSIPGFDGVI